MGGATRRVRLEPRHRRAARQHAAPGPAADRPAAPAAPRSAGGRGRRPGLGVGLWAAKERRQDPGAIAVGAVAPTPHGRRATRPHLHQAGPDHLERRGALPLRARRRVQGLSGPGACGDVRRCPPGGRGGPRAHRSKRCSSTSSAARSPQRPSHRSTPHVCTRSARRRWAATSWSRSSGPTIRTQVHSDLKVMAWLAPFLVGRIPIAALANPPALVELFAETIAEELDFRLEAENMLDVAQSCAELGQRGVIIARPHPELVTRRGPGDGAAVRLQLRRPGVDAGRGDRHPRGAAARHGGVHRGVHGPRHLPRRPARREPVHHLRRPHRAAGLRHHRSDDRPGAHRLHAAHAELLRWATSAGRSPRSGTSARSPPTPTSTT